MNEQYCFTPDDIALFLLLSEMPLRDGNEMLDDLFHAHNMELIPAYRQSFRLFREAVRVSSAMITLGDHDYAEAELIIHELNLSMPEWGEYDDCTSYFKFTRLSLLYSGIEYRRLKLRTLLKVFGYRRRSEQLMQKIHAAMDSLQLQAYLKGYVACDLAEIQIDQMVMIRLKVDQPNYTNGNQLME